MTAAPTPRCAATPEHHPLLVRGRDLLGDAPFLLMGILNITPDSFSDGGLYLSPPAASARASEMVAEGADILDLGAESTRPGSAPVEPAEELRRLLPVLRAIRKAHPEIPISVDTRKAAVASEALDAGADLINDISAGLHDPAMLPLLGARRAPVILMHMRGTPETMQDAPSYGDPLAEVAGELAARVSAARAAGLGPGSIVVDPGIGFGKRPGDNLALLAGIPTLCALGAPVLVGLSRKSLVGHLTGAPAEARLPGTLAFHAAALLAGARIFRVHDVAAHRQALTCAAAVMGHRRGGE